MYIADLYKFHLYLCTMISAGVGMKLAVACAPVRRVHKNKEYSASDYEVAIYDNIYLS